MIVLGWQNIVRFWAQGCSGSVFAVTAFSHLFQLGLLLRPARRNGCQSPSRHAGCVRGGMGAEVSGRNIWGHWIVWGSREYSGRGLFGAEVAEAFPRTPALRAGALGDGWAGRANSSRAEYFQEHLLIAETPHSPPKVAKTQDCHFAHHDTVLGLQRVLQCRYRLGRCLIGPAADGARLQVAR